MKEEHLKKWLWEATGEKDPDTNTWGKLASTMQVAFRYGYIPEALTPTTMLLIPKYGGGYIVTGLVEVIWKVCTLILNN